MQCGGSDRVLYTCTKLAVNGDGGAVARVKVRKENLTAGDGVQEDVIDVQMWNKNQAIDSALKHLGMLSEKHEHDGNINIGWLTDADPDP